MSYDHDLRVGWYAKGKFAPNQTGSSKHWLLDERWTEEQLSLETNGQATLADVDLLKGAYYSFPEFFNDKKTCAYIMLPGYTEGSDVSRSDSMVIEGPSTDIPTKLMVYQEALQRLFGFAEVSFHYGAIVTVV